MLDMPTILCYTSIIKYFAEFRYIIAINHSSYAVL